MKSVFSIVLVGLTFWAGGKDCAAQDSDTLVLVSPLTSKFVYLIDSDASVVHQWTFDVAGSNAYLFPNGSLMRSAQVPEGKAFDLRGQAGRIQKVDWDGNLLWDFEYADETKLQHHDYEVLPGGNVLLIACEKKTRDEAIAAGRDPAKLSGDEFYTETVVEIEPDGKTGGREVWRWQLWDHLVQDFAADIANHGDPASSPRRVDLNYAKNGNADWIHMNAIDYNATLDQIVVSPRYMDELWFLDHSTTTAQAATSTGGRYGHGGDLLYRMGNPAAYEQIDGLSSDAEDHLVDLSFE